MLDCQWLSWQPGQGSYRYNWQVWRRGPGTRQPLVTLRMSDKDDTPPAVRFTTQGGRWAQQQQQEGGHYPRVCACSDLQQF
ncbi:hypothetical protein HaLaN_21703, partial [Haematococcus lacustris]